MINLCFEWYTNAVINMKNRAGNKIAKVKNIGDTKTNSTQEVDKLVDINISDIEKIDDSELLKKLLKSAVMSIAEKDAEYAEEVARIESRHQEQVKKISAEYDKRIASIKTEADNAKAELAFTRDITLVKARTIEELVNTADRKTLNLDEFQLLRLHEMIESISDLCISFIDKNRKLAQELYGDCTEQIHTPNTPKDTPSDNDADEDNPAGDGDDSDTSTENGSDGSSENKEGQEEQQKHVSANATISKACSVLKSKLPKLKNLSDNQTDELIQTLINIKSILLLTKDPEENGRSRGKQSVDRSYMKQRRVEIIAKIDKCTKCNHKKFVSIGSLQSNLTSIINDLQELVSHCEIKIDLAMCEHCGQVYISNLDELSAETLPVTPSSSVSLSLAVHIICWNAMGVSTNRIAEPIRNYAQMGKSTLPDNVHKFCEIYIMPLYDRLREELGLSDITLFDETPLDVLGCMGKGPLADQIDSEDKSSQTYLLAASNPDWMEHRVRLFTFMKGRAAPILDDAIIKLMHFDDLKVYKDKEKKVLDEEKTLANLREKLEGRVLITDGYRPYSSIVNKYGMKHQRCLIHLRRKIIDGIGRTVLHSPDELLASLDDDKELARRITEGDPLALMLICLTLTNLIYAVEREADKRGEDYLDQIRQLRSEKSARLMDALDMCMERLSERAVKIGPRGGVSKVNGEIAADACSYFQQYKDNLHEYLHDPRVCPDEQLCEQIIRVVAMCKHTMLFKQNPKYADDLAMCLSVVATLRANGIDNVEEYLNDYCCAMFKHCLETQATVLYKEDKAKGKRWANNLDFAFEQNSRTMDLTPYLPWVWQGRRNRG